MVFSSSGEERRIVMSTKMGFWRWALASAAILTATGPAGARVIDPTGVTTDEPTALVLYPRLKVDPNTCEAGFCSLTPKVACTSNTDCNGCNGTHCRLNTSLSCTKDSDCPGAGVDTIVQLPPASGFLHQVKCFFTTANLPCRHAQPTICTHENFRSAFPSGGLCDT